MEAKRNKTVVLNSFWSILVLLITFSTMMSSCVEGDLYDLYDEEDLNISSNVPQTKGWLDDWWLGLVYGRVKDYWLENECGLWAVMCMNGNTEDTKSNRLFYMRKIAHAIDPSINDESSERDVCVTYYTQINQGGINNPILRSVLNSTIGNNGYNEYNSTNTTQLNNFWSAIGVSSNNTNISDIDNVVVVQQTGVHYGILESIEDGIFTMSTYGDEQSTCELSEIGSFFVRNN